jgi:hypothetical protein
MARGAIHQLLATDVALDKLGARAISAQEAEQLPRNHHVVARNPHERASRGGRLLLVGLTDGGRALTLVIERTADPTTWLIVTGWSSTVTERKLLGRSS